MPESVNGFHESEGLKFKNSEFGVVVGRGAQATGMFEDGQILREGCEPVEPPSSNVSMLHVFCKLFRTIWAALSSAGRGPLLKSILNSILEVFCLRIHFHFQF